MSELNKYNINIYVLNNNLDCFIEKIKESCECFSINNLDNNDNLQRNITAFWRWIPLIGSEEENIKLLLELLKKKIEICFDKKNNHTFKEVIIITNNSLSKEIIQSFFDQLEEILDEKSKYYHPFVIFLTKEKINVNYDEYENLDDKKIFFLDFPTDEFSLSALIFKLIQCCSYYNELGDYFYINGYPYQSISENDEYPTYLNILISGRSQSGKSTFINLLLNEKRAKEGGNNCGCSQVFQKYKVLNYPIRLYDTIGFGDEDKDIENMKNYFKKMDDELTNAKEKIHLILYFIDGGAGNKFSKNEIILLEELLKRNIIILYIVTKFDFNPEKNIDKYKIELMKIYKSLTSIIGKKSFPSKEDEENLKRFLGVNLVKNHKRPAFGFNTIIQTIYSYFNSEAIILRVIKRKYEEKQNNEEIKWEDIYEILKDNFFFNHLKNYEEIENKYQQKAQKAIDDAKLKLAFLGCIPIIDLISHHYINKSLNKEIQNAFKNNSNSFDKKMENEQFFAKNTIKSEESSKGFFEKLAVNVANFFNRTFFKISEEGDKMMNSNLEKFRQVNFNITMSLIDSILKGIEFFEKFCLSQDK